VIDATVVREAWTSGPQDGQDPITDATVVDDPGETP
jgi:hypothetical protein